MSEVDHGRGLDEVVLVECRDELIQVEGQVESIQSKG